MSPTQFIDQGFITPDYLGFSSILSQQAMAIWASAWPHRSGHSPT